MTAHDPSAATRYDVAVLGGALSGAATVLQVLQADPAARVLIVEKSPTFSRRVGESTVEVSSYFLGRVLGLHGHLNEHHLVKQGLRYWFANGRTQTLADCSEIGPKFSVRLPAYQVDRAVLDEEVLRRAAAAGAEVRRPAKVVGRVELQPGGDQSFTVRDADGREERVRARWVVDASGVAALLSRQQGFWRANAAHPTASVWTRWSGVKDWDGPELARKFPAWAARVHTLRNTATNHLVGDGWWSWWILLKGGDVSIGVVYDQRLVELPEGGTLPERLKRFLTERHPVAREMLADAQPREGDAHFRRNLPYSSTTYAGDGFSLVGDAGAFIDPLYSPGIDWIAYTTANAADLALAARRGEPDLGERIARANFRLVRGYERWFQSVYQDKYEYLGDYELLRIAFLFDLGLYYLGVVSQPFKRGAAALLEPIFSSPPSTPFYRFMRFYNRRLAQMARVRRARGTLGRRNDRRTHLLAGFSFSANSARPLLQNLGRWGWLELTEGWRSWWQRPDQATMAMATTQVTAAPITATAQV